jgi:hypothetical protein
MQLLDGSDSGNICKLMLNLNLKYLFHLKSISKYRKGQYSWTREFDNADKKEIIATIYVSHAC